MRSARLAPAAGAAAAALLLVPLSPGTAHAAPGEGASPTAVHTENARWPGGYQAQITITNPGAEPLEDWSLEFELPEGAEVHQMWNAELAEPEGSGGYTAAPPHWGADVPPGGSYTFGYNGRYDGDGPTDPVSCTLDGAPCTDGGNGGEDPEYRQVGYFTQWGADDKDFHVKSLETTGQADKLTHVNYAFANLDEDGRCFASDTEGEGEALSDYGRAYTAENSVDGVADDPDQPLRGSFNQLRKLKERHPGLKVSIALGGWEWSTHFSNAALPENREEAVASCVDMFLRGNLPERNGAGGEGAAAGLFDGIDLDWEWPATPGAPGNVVRPEDKENFTALVAEFREQMDGLGEETGQDYLLTSFMPADTGAIDAGYEVPALMEDLDFINVQGYDLTGAWNPSTGHQSNVRTAEGDPAAEPRSYETVVGQWVDRGADPEDIVMGVPFYGRGWQGVEPGPDGDGLWQPADGAAPGPRDPGYNDYNVLKEMAASEEFTVYRDDHAGTAWIYDGDQWWNYDDAAAISQKASWAREYGLGGAMVWSLDGDGAEGELMSALDGELNGR
ncbi:glycosyl hydrolase family 18 protein [Nocardiopsis halophila]|uniref:glycosyl hydrolase family 18 protein n=1 Tax=Nocardiopsis halophila TaxID=141692 RepID=UPI00034D7FF5|nr:glycosyl hydrolase family 18 protein [Nocardiopsis halophila]